MKLTKEQLRQIIKQEINESYGDMFDPYNPEGHAEPTALTLSGSESANNLRMAIKKFVADNPQLANPKMVIAAIVNEIMK
tara:strand:- start:81 stop:320 length:240 start_codon:yes stop_codon:yes gene_type:complete